MPNGARHWCFTINNWTFDEEIHITDPNLEHRQYLVFGREVGEEGTPHLQGFVSFSERKTLSWLKSNFSERAHFKPADGTPQQASDYCKKGNPPFTVKNPDPDADFWEDGEVPESRGAAGGKRQIERYDEARQAAKEGRFDDIPSDLYIRHRTSFHAIRGEQSASNLPHVNCYWIWGPSGTSKTHFVTQFCEAKGITLYMKNATSKWFCGYNREDAVFLNDWDETCDQHTCMLKLLADRYRVRVETKHGSIEIRPKIIFVTSNLLPQDCIRNPVHRDPILRRFKVINRNIPYDIPPPPSIGVAEFMDEMDQATP